jgi:hypothetical protein
VAQAIAALAGTGGASVTIAATAPGSPTAGDLWWDSEGGVLMIYYNDGSSSQWVEASRPGGASGGGGDLLAANNLSELTASASTARANLGLTIGTHVQAYDTDLATYAGIPPSGNVQTLLAAADHSAFKTSLSLQNVDNTSNATERAATATLTNKRITSRTDTIASNATWAPNSDTTDLFLVTAQAVAATTISNPSGTPTAGQRLMIRAKCDGTNRALTWSGTQWRASSDLALPTTLLANKTMYLGFMWNAADSKWDLLAKLDNF